MVRSIGIQARVVYNPAEDHVWCEVLINGSWFHFDPGLSRDKRFNNPGFYECPEPNGWGKELSYVYFIDADGKQNDITKTYTDIGRLIVQVEKDGQPVKNARVTIESRFLMLNQPSSYSQPIFYIENRTNDKGICTFNLGGNNYTVSAELGTILGYRNESIISLKENRETSVTLTLSSFSLLIPIEYVITTLGVALTVILLVIEIISIYKKSRKKKANVNT